MTLELAELSNATQKTCPWRQIKRKLGAVFAVLDMRKDPLKYFTDLMYENRQWVGYRLGLDRVTMLNDPLAIRHVMVEQGDKFIKSQFYQPLRSVLGGGILMSEGEEWLGQRRATASLFSGTSIEDMSGKITEITAELIEELELRRLRGGGEVQICQEMMHIAFGAALYALFNVKLNVQQREDVYAAFTSVLKAAEGRIWSLIKPPLAVDELINPLYQPAIPALRKLAAELLAERRSQNDQTDNLLARMIADAKARDVSDKALIGQVLTMILAAHETATITMGWVWYLLSQHPEAAKEFYHEIDTVLGTRKPDYTDINNLNYTRALIEETMRLYPPVWTISRTAIRAADLPFSNGQEIRIPKNTHVMLCAYAMHRHPDLWSSPEKFNPARFINPKERSNLKYQYFPFGGGARNCLGDRFAMMEMPLILAMLGQKYRFTLSAGQTVKATAMTTLRPSSDIRMHIHARQDLDAITPQENSGAHGPSSNRGTSACPFGFTHEEA